VWLGTIKGSNVRLHSYTSVFSLEETDEILTFVDLLQPNNANYVMNQEQFDGFFICKSWRQEFIDWTARSIVCKNQAMVR
jgi:hypothetical protein